MPSFTSCYFCGDAVGASLDEYDLPADASPNEQVTVTLCAGCKGKLTELLDEIDPSGGVSGTTTQTAPAGDAAAESDADVDPATETDPDLDPVAGDQEPIFADDGDAVLDEELPPGASVEGRPFATDDEDESADESDDATVADAPDRHEEPSSSGEPASDTDASADDSSESDGAIAAPPAGEAETDPDASDADDSGTEPDSSGATDGEDDSGDAATAPPVEANAGGSGSGASAASDSGGSSTDGPLADVSPRTYNRVVRLLQNREFPVDRADFEALATSAYELDHGECAAALDGAIEKGLLEEHEGMLHRPE